MYGKNLTCILNENETCMIKNDRMWFTGMIEPTSIDSKGTKSPMTAASISLSGCTLPPLRPDISGTARLLVSGHKVAENIVLFPGTVHYQL